MSTLAPWRGDLHIRPGIVAFTGLVGAADPHAHAAVQLIWCREGEVEVTDGSGTSVCADAMVIPAWAAHSIRVARRTFATTVFLDPSGSWAPQRGEWTQSVRGWVDDERADFAISTLRGTLNDPPTNTPGRFGARIEEWVRERLPDRVVVSDLAAELNVSVATLRRHAHAELGLSVQAYARWIRLIIALEHVGAGESITDAATAAGFADGSHASRACREMFGMAPSDAIAHLTISRG